MIKNINKTAYSRGFTLIEISIVLVIIGFLVGGVLVGRDLITAAVVRAQIAQIEKFSQATQTFRGKYGYLPGDIRDPEATSFGFSARNTDAGGYIWGNGNGQVEGRYSSIGPNCSLCVGTGESGLFWVDLTRAKLLEGSFSSATITNYAVVATAMSNYFPQAKIANNYIAVWSGGWQASAQANLGGSMPFVGDGNNYFAIAPYSYVQSVGVQYMGSPKMSVQQAFYFDKKVDDGLPQSGSVIALAPLMSGNAWAGQSYSGAYDPTTYGPVVAGDGVATQSFWSVGGPATCYDNNNVAGATENYSITDNKGQNMACWLSVRAQ